MATARGPHGDARAGQQPVPSEARSGRPPLLGMVAALSGLFLILTAVAWSIGAEVSRGAAVPGDEALAAAAAILDAELDKGDAIAFAPAWSASQRWRMAKVYGDHALDFDAAAIIGEPVTTWDAGDFKRLWVVATHGHADRVDVSALGSALRHEELGQGVALLLIELPPSNMVYNFRRALDTAVLERVSKDGKGERCRAQPDRQKCRGGWWRDAFSSWNEVGGTRHRCIYLQPDPSGGVTRLSWGKVPAATALAGRFGNRLWAVRHEQGSEVELRVTIGDRVRYVLKVQPGDFGWHPFRIDLDPAEHGKPVGFEWRAEDALWRQTCLDARLLGPAP